MTPGAILTDIEGTTSSIAFVKEVLFPYAREHLKAFVAAHRDEPAVAAQLAAVRAEAGAHLSDPQVVEVLRRWIDADRKATPLKALQGMVWRAGFEAGDYVGHMYPDAVARLRAWRAAGIPLYVYSSGSVEAQRLYFAHSDHGDLSGLFAGHFDTTTGPKQEPASYRAIAAAIDRPAGAILFLSDVAAELDAAAAAGLATTWLVRAGDPPLHPGHPVARDFDQVDVSL